MNHPTQPDQGYVCPAEGCPLLLKNSTWLSRHLQTYHPEVQYYDGVFDPCTVLSFI